MRTEPLSVLHPRKVMPETTEAQVVGNADHFDYVCPISILGNRKRSESKHSGSDLGPKASVSVADSSFFQGEIAKKCYGFVNRENIYLA